MPNEKPVSPSCCGHSNEDQLLATLEIIITDQKNKPGALIPVLQTAQNLFGYLPLSALKKIALGLAKPLSEVTGVVSFYSFFSTVPRGKYLVRVCLGTACYVRGGKDMLNALKLRLGIDVGETTTDRLFSLDLGRCFGACGLAPVLMVNDTVHQRVKAAKVGEILDIYKCRELDAQGVKN